MTKEAKDKCFTDEVQHKTSERCALVCTYKQRQLAWIKKNRVYNYPVKDEDRFSKEALESIRQLWLYSDAKGRRHSFSAKYEGRMTREEFCAKYPSYEKLGKSKSREYYVFSVEDCSETQNPGEFQVLVRISDFARRSAKVKAAAEKFLKTREFGKLSEYLPRDLEDSSVGGVDICDGFQQTDFLGLICGEEKIDCPFPAPEKGRFTFIDLFAGIGGIRLGFQMNGGKCVFSSEWDKDAATTYYYNFGERPNGDIQKIDPASIPDFDVLLAGFPCQPFSIIGDKEGFNHETQGTLFFNIEKILLAKKPKAFMLENVRNLTVHDNGRTFKVILSHLENAGYDVHYKVLNALDYGVPQKRERIIICGFRKKTDFEFPPPVPEEERKTIADIIDADAEKDRSLFVREEIRKSRIARLKNKDYPRPYISHENVAGAITPHHFSCALRAGASANYILINDERRPSAREMLRIQGFPEEFKIVVGYGKIKHQTGNSVAVPVIKAVAERIVEKLEQE